MCLPAQAATKTIFFFKIVEPIFWIAQVWLLVSLTNPKYFFKGNLKVINWLIKCQGFDVKLPMSEKALKIWTRDLTILFFLNPIVIFLIHLL